MEEEVVITRERRLIGRKPWEYPELTDQIEVSADTGFGEAGAKLDPSSGALKYDKYEDIELRKRLQRAEPEPKPKPEPKPSAIRFSLDSHAQIHIKEDEEVSIAANGHLQDHSTRGMLSVKNLSDKDRLWDINVMLREDTGLALVDFDEVNATELEPGTKVSNDYQIGNYAPSINVHEIISTHQDYPESIILKKDKKTHVTFELGLKNISKNPFKNIVLKKSLPKNLKEAHLQEIGTENVSIGDNRLTWRIDELDSNEVKVITFEGDIEPEMATEIPIGDIDLEATGKDTITRFIVTSYNAMCRNMYYIEADETDEPGSWFCRFVCENTSSFEVEILKVEIRDSTTNQLYLNLTNPGIIVPPNKRWESESWIVEGKERPSFIKNLILNVIPGITKEMNFKLTKEGGIFKVGSLKFSKYFDKNKAVAGRITDLGVKIEIENTGSAALEHLVVRDSLPRFIARPSNLVIERGTIPLTENVRFSVIPSEATHNEDKEFSIFINDLSKFGGALTKGEKVVITYDTQIYKPTPREEIVAGADVAAKPYLPGPVLTADAAGAIPTVNILQILRKFSIGKSIEQGTGVGEYNIGLLYQNRGNQPIKNLVIKDILPKNFMGSDYTLDPEQEPTVDQGMILTWNIPLLKEGEITKIRYKIKGEGEYHPRDAQIFYNYTPE